MNPFRGGDIPDGAEAEDDITGDYMAHKLSTTLIKSHSTWGKVLALPFMPIYHMELFVYSCFILPKCVLNRERERE